MTRTLVQTMALRKKKAIEGLRAGVLLGTFGGTLRSELDEPGTLHPALEDILTRYVALHRQYDDGEISEGDFGKLLGGLIYTDSEGTQWTIGASTTRWYRKRPGGRWSLTPPDLVAKR